MNSIGQPRQNRILLRQTARHIPHQILQQIGRADGGNHDGHARRRAQGLVSHALHHEAQRHSQQNHQRHGNRQGKRRRQVDHEEACSGENVAVGKIDETQNAVDHGIAYGDQRILSANGDTCEEIRQNGIKHIFILRGVGDNVRVLGACARWSV